MNNPKHSVNCVCCGCLPKGVCRKDLQDVSKLLLTRKTHAGTLRESWEAGKLLLDFDGPVPPFPVLCFNLRRLGLHPERMYYAHSSSGVHWHVVIFLKEKLPIMETLFVQLFLGSDRVRERCNFIRAFHYKRNDEFTQILFGRKLTKKEMKKL
jgi:hypothetical protein